MTESSEAFNAGFLGGIAFVLVLTFVSYHLGESNCQRDNNVADCGFTSQPFVPYTD